MFFISFGIKLSPFPTVKHVARGMGGCYDKGIRYESVEKSK